MGRSVQNARHTLRCGISADHRKRQWPGSRTLVGMKPLAQEQAGRGLDMGKLKAIAATIKDLM